MPLDSKIRYNYTKYVKQILLLTFVFFAAADLRAQINEEWVYRYNGSVNSDDYFYDVKTDKLDNVILTGYSQEGTINKADILVVKLTPSGQLIWLKKFNGTSNQNDYGKNIEVDSENNIYVLGTTINSGTLTDVTAIKLTSAGDLIWLRNYNAGNDRNDYSKDMIIDSIGNLYITGYSDSAQESSNCITIKYDSTGTLLWSNIYRTNYVSHDRGNKIVFDKNGNIIVTGTGFTQNSGFDYLTIKYDVTGNTIWAKTFNDEPDISIDNGESIITDINNNVFVTGSCSNSITFRSNIVTVKYNSAGQIIWAKKFNGLGNDDDYPVDILVDNSNNVIVGGRTTGFNSSFDYLVLKYSNSGDSIWNRKYSGPGNYDDILSAVSIDNLNNIYVTGDLFSSNSNIFTVKYNDAGDIVWTKSFNGTGNGNDIPNNLFIDNANNLYISGISLGTNTNLDAIGIKYSQPIGINPISIDIPKSFKLHQNYPNPFNPITKISFEIPVIGTNVYTSLTIYDITGRIVSVLVNEQLQPGKYEIEWNAENFTSGVYFYTLSTGNYKETKKMLLIK